MMHRTLLPAFFLAAVAVRGDTLDTLKAQNALRPRDTNDVTLGEIANGDAVRRMAPPRTSPGKLVLDKDGSFAWQTPGGPIVPAKMVAMARDPSSIAAARAELESAILESAGVARGKPADKAGALAAAAAEHRKGNGKDVVKGLGLLAAGAALGSAAGRKGKVTA